MNPIFSYTICILFCTLRAKCVYQKNLPICFLNLLFRDLFIIQKKMYKQLICMMIQFYYSSYLCKPNLCEQWIYVSIQSIFVIVCSLSMNEIEFYLWLNVVFHFIFIQFWRVSRHCLNLYIYIFYIIGWNLKLLSPN